jgi:PAS domain S-box-containing protein
MKEDRFSQPTCASFKRRYADLFEFVPIGYFIFDSSGVIVDVNSAGARLLATERHRLLHQPMNDFIHLESQAVFAAHRQLLLKTRSLQACDVQRAKPGQNPVWLHFESLVIESQGSAQLQIRSVVKDFTACKQIEITLRKTRDELEKRVARRTAELENSNRQLRRKITECEYSQAALHESSKELRILSNQLLSAEENERSRIARELHDGIGQALSAIKFSVENCLSRLRKIADQPEVKALESIIPLTQKTIAEVRRIVEALRPAMLDDLGILATVTWVCREFQSIYGNIRIKTRIDLGEEDIPALLKTVIYRILQEALNNVAKHSGADQIQLFFSKTGDRLELTVADNGVGFDLERVMAAKPSRRGFGLATMRERAGLSGGVFGIHAVAGEGTTIRVAWDVSSI